MHRHARARLDLTPAAIGLAGLLACLPVAAQEAVTLFGLPLGGTLPVDTIKCVAGDKPVSRPCWIDLPKPVESRSTGAIRVPQDRLPKWSEFARFEVLLGKDKRVQRLSLSRVPYTKRAESIDSIGMRFGVPTGQRTDARFPAAWWYRPQMKVMVACTPKDGCNYSFTSATLSKELADEQAARDKAEAARPKTP